MATSEIGKVSYSLWRRQTAFTVPCPSIWIGTLATSGSVKQCAAVRTARRPTIVPVHPDPPESTWTIHGRFGAG